MLTLPFNASREIFQGEIFLVMLLLSSQDFTGHRESFYMWEIAFTLAFTCLYLSLFIYRPILRLCDCKFVFQRVSRKCHHSNEKGTVTKARSLFVGGLEIFPKKSLHRENSQTSYLYGNKGIQKNQFILIYCSFFKALPIMKVFDRKTIITADSFIFPFSRKKSFTIFT